MTNGTGAECKSYSCEEHSGTPDKFIHYIHNKTIGSKQKFLRKGKEDKTVTCCVHIYFLKC